MRSCALVREIIRFVGSGLMRAGLLFLPRMQVRGFAVYSQLGKASLEAFAPAARRGVGPYSRAATTAVGDGAAACKTILTRAVRW